MSTEDIVIHATTKLRRLAERVLELDPQSSDFAEKLREVQGNASAALTEQAGPGNPNIERARKVSAKARADRALERRAEILPIIIKLREGGKHSYREIGEALDGMGIKPERGDRWSTSSVRAMELGSTKKA